MGKGPFVTFVIMAGGRGERLWPLVRKKIPKVCLSLDGKHTLLSSTVKRLRPAWPNARWLIVTSAEQAHAVKKALPVSMRGSVIVEPQIKNTAACITLASITEARLSPQRVLVVVPADHWIGDEAAFRKCVRAGIKACVSKDTIATIGIRPTHAHMGLGYLCAGAEIRSRWGRRAFRLKRFLEKPSRSIAERLIRRRGTYWNSGIFIGTADKFLECVSEWLPEHSNRLVPVATKGVIGSLTRRSRKAYQMLKSISFDYGVMDQLKEGIVIEGDFPWEDLGTWDRWIRFKRTHSQLVGIGGKNVQVVSRDAGHLVAAIGVEDLIIVTSPSATLVCRPKDSQSVREIVQRLSKSQRLARYC